MTNPRADGRLRLEIDVGERTVVRLVGELDTTDAHSIRKLLTAYIRAGTTIAADLSAVTYVGSGGLAVLVDLHGLARRQGSRLVVLTGADGPVRRALEVAGLGETLDIGPAPGDGRCPARGPGGVDHDRGERSGRS
ncbi:STAS domain-containing protein [Pseudonocardia yuanmonensis]